MSDTPAQYLDIVRILWVDSFGGFGWQPRADLIAYCESGEHHVESVGYLAYQDDTSKVLVQNIGETNNVTGYIKIPKRCIIEETVIRRGKPE